MARYIPKILIVILALQHIGLTLASPYKTIPMNRKHLATFYIDVSLAEREYQEFMVDTGAGYTTINEQTLKRLLATGNAEYIGQLTGVMADGSRQHLPLYLIKQLVLGEDCVLYDIEAAVFPEETRMLLGLNALEKAAPFVFSTNPPLLSVSNCGTTAGIY